MIRHSLPTRPDRPRSAPPRPIHRTTPKTAVGSAPAEPPPVRAPAARAACPPPCAPTKAGRAIISQHDAQVVGQNPMYLVKRALVAKDVGTLFVFHCNARWTAFLQHLWARCACSRTVRFGFIFKAPIGAKDVGTLFVFHFNARRTAGQLLWARCASTLGQDVLIAGSSLHNLVQKTSSAMAA